MSLDELLTHSGIAGVSERNLVGTDSKISQEQILRILSGAEESKEVRGFYQSDVEGSILGRALNFILDRKGYEKAMPDHYVWLDLDDNVGAVTITLDNGTRIVGYNKNHQDRIRKNPMHRMYLALHEHTHIRGEYSEAKTDGNVKDAALMTAQTAYNKILSLVPNNLKEILNKALGIAEYASMRERAQLRYGT